MLKMKETALLVIDMQYGGGAPDGSLVKMLNVDVSKQEDIVTPMVKLKDFFRANGMLVVNIKTEYEEDFRDWPMLAERFEVRKHGHFIKGSPDAEIIPPLAPSEGEELVVKNRWDAFFDTNLDELLKSRDIKNLVLTGAATDVCVLETCSHEQGDRRRGSISNVRIKEKAEADCFCFSIIKGKDIQFWFKMQIPCGRF